jgi:hypothetical protein
MSLIRTLALAAAIAAASAVAGAARAQDGGGAGGVTWQVTRLGENFDVEWSPGARPATHGGGVAARILGGGDNATIVYAEMPAIAQAPVVARLSGGGDDAVITYTAPGAAATGRALARGPAVPGQGG